MKPLSAKEIATILRTSVLTGDANIVASAGISTDTRNLPEGCLFIALRGENFNANEFASQALREGAAITIVDTWDHESPTRGAVIKVSDTLLALQQLATWWRLQLSIKAIGLTGSNGKTSTKDFIASILSEKYKVCATRGNLNNHIGLPLTVLETTLDDRAAVYEMGMNHAGEIAPLVAICQPNIAIITNIGSAHIEFLESREAIAKEKASVAQSLKKEEVLVIPHDCDFLDLVKSTTQAKVITTGGIADQVRAENNSDQKFTLIIDSLGKAEVTLPVAGQHMISNALLAAAAGFLSGCSLDQIVNGLVNTTLTSGRLRRFESNGITIFDDTYNANPESIIAGLETLANTKILSGGVRYAVLGKMAELGNHTITESKRVGLHAAKNQIITISVGDGAGLISQHAGLQAKHFSTREEASEWLRKNLKENDIVLFKGSRTSAIEIVMKQTFPQL
jgi:UDP-N-acetylmuramoyl-tripeptide--D-alanyl-D-alanine ligase